MKAGLVRRCLLQSQVQSNDLGDCNPHHHHHHRGAGESPSAGGLRGDLAGAGALVLFPRHRAARVPRQHLPEPQLPVGEYRRVSGREKSRGGGAQAHDSASGGTRPPRASGFMRVPHGGFMPDRPGVVPAPAADGSHLRRPGDAQLRGLLLRHHQAPAPLPSTSAPAKPASTRAGGARCRGAGRGARGAGRGARGAGRGARGAGRGARGAGRGARGAGRGARGAGRGVPRAGRGARKGSSSVKRCGFIFCKWAGGREGERRGRTLRARAVRAGACGRQHPPARAWRPAASVATLQA